MIDEITLPPAKSVLQTQPRFKTAPNVVACDVETGLALLDVETATYFALNKVGAAVWALLSEPRTLDQLVAGVTEAYDVEPERCRADVAALLHMLENAKLIQSAD